MSEDVRFFSEVDYVTTKDGKKVQSSEFPAWYFDNMIDEMQESLLKDEQAIKAGRLSGEQLASARDRVERYRDRLSKIEESRPALDKDKVSKNWKELGKNISSMMYSRSQMQKGIAPAEGEAKRMVQPCVPVTPEIQEYAKACNVPVVDGKVSRNGAEKIWKLCGRYLGEITNSEVLRKD